jgi:hypothetical protein
MHGRKVALVKPGRKWVRVLMMEDRPLTVRRVPMSETKYFGVVRTSGTMRMKQGKAYPIRRAIRHYRNHAKAHGSTKTAQRFLTEAAKSA